MTYINRIPKLSITKHGQPDPVRISVVRFYHPEIAAEMLSKDENKFVSAIMSFSVGVYIKKDGKTYVSSMNLGLMRKVMGSSVVPVLKQVAEHDAQIHAFLREE